MKKAKEQKTPKKEKAPPFFFNPEKPLVLRLGLALLLAAVVIYPSFVKKRNTGNGVRQTTIKMEDASQTSSGMLGGEDPKAPLPSPEPEQALASNSPSKDEPSSPETKAEDSKATAENSESPTEPVEEESEIERTESSQLFKRIKGIKGKVLWITGPQQQSPSSPASQTNKSVWVGTSKSLIEFREGSLSNRHNRLDPKSYESLFNLDMPEFTAFEQDKQGRIFVGTKDGQLMIYRNSDWKILWEARDPVANPITGIAAIGNSIYVSSIGVLKWTETTGAISRITAFKNAPISFLSRDSQDGLTLISKAEDETAGAWRLMDETWEHVLAPEDNRNPISFLTTGSKEILYYATERGLLQGSPEQAVPDSVLPDVKLSTLFVEPNGRIWGTSEAEGLLVYDNKQWFKISPNSDLPYSDATTLFVDSSNQLWLGGVKQLYTASVESVLKEAKANPYSPKIYDPNAPLIYPTACRAASTELKPGEASGEVALEMIDDTPTVFFRGSQVCPDGFGSRRADGSIAIIRNHELLVSIKGAEGKRNSKKIEDRDRQQPKIFSLYLDSRGTAWVGLDGKIMSFTERRADTIDEEGSPNNGPVDTISEDSGGRLWFGTAPVYPQPTETQGQTKAKQEFIPCLYLLHEDKWASISGKEGLPGWFVNDLLPMADGSMAVAMNRGTVAVSPSGVKVIAPKMEKSLLSVAHLSLDEKGRIWRAHSFAHPGLTWIDGESVHSTVGRKALFEERVGKIAHDGRGRAWIQAANGSLGIYTSQALESEDKNNSEKKSLAD